MLVGIVAANEAGIEALFFYLAAYAFMNLAAFAVITIRERETGFGDDIRSVQGLGRERPVLAWPLTIAMLGLAGLPGTAGFIGKLYLIEASVAADFTWLGVMIAVGHDDLARLLPARHRRGLDAPRLPLRPDARGRPPRSARRWPAARAKPARKARRIRCRVIIGFSLIAAFAVVFFGIMPSPLVDFVSGTGEAITSSLG